MSGDGERLDIHLVRLGYAPSRRAAQSLIDQGLVRVNGRRGPKGALVTAGESVEVEVAPESERLEIGIVPNPEIPLEVLFQDDAALVINKPAPMPCHPLRRGERDTVMNAVVARFPEAGLAGAQAREGGLVHRLDNGTSGALIVARTSGAFGTLREAIRTGSIIRRYEALVAGEIRSPMRLDDPIAHHPKNRRKMIVLKAAAIGQPESQDTHQARPAVTIVEPISRLGGFTLVSVAPKTGNRHQIRVHLAAAGHPLAGDALYGGPALATLATDRFWLHLCELGFDSPASGQVRVQAPHPADLVKSLRALRSLR
jgi:23S rRNA pseudouridine1911/1915/1917 synthase